MPETQATKHLQPTLSKHGKKLGRPSTFNEATATLICERLADGETLTSICKTHGMPKRQVVLRWRRRNPTFDAEYLQARADGMECMSDEILEIADDGTLDTYESEGKNGRVFMAVNNANIQRDKLRVDTRKFLMAKINPRYASKVEHNISGTVDHQHTVSVSDRERMRRLASFMLEDKAGQIIEGTASDAAIPTCPPTVEPQPAPVVESKDISDESQ